MHNQIHVWTLKMYIAGIFTNTLKTVKFPDYNISSNVNVVPLNKISDTIDNVAPINEIRLKTNTSLIMRLQRL